MNTKNEPVMNTTRKNYFINVQLFHLKDIYRDTTDYKSCVRKKNTPSVDMKYIWGIGRKERPQHIGSKPLQLSKYEEKKTKVMQVF